MTGNVVADRHELVEDFFPKDVRRKFEIFSYRNAVAIPAQNFSHEFSQITRVLQEFEITTTMIRMPGGSKGLIARYVEGLFPSPDWKETRITADLHVKLLPSKGDEPLLKYVRSGYSDGHRIDFVSGKVALDFEWNSKDQTYDRDLYAFSAFHAAGAIEVGILLTRGNSMSTDFMRTLGKVLMKTGQEGPEEVYKKFGASTTFTGKPLYRLEAGRNGGCPILALGITPECVADYTGRG
ncbi:MAG: BglII/BstYI family type II restriction endonuclease [Albidovulum sp.]|nr:BglII/BstYI family type II restriction endonuclease [Albidovulum sp.]MDE0533806.1 BglII/BstYI family type II restriction endonuclease [Albidovulum sp.]